MTRVAAIASAVLFAIVSRAAAAQAGAGTPSVADLPLHLVRAERPSGRLAVLLSGDGGWAAFNRNLSARLAQEGIDVVGLDSRSYLGTPRSPDVVATDLARILHNFLGAWNASRASVIGYSRGADIAPFAVNRLSDDLRRAVDQVVLVGLGAAANFTFHWQDLLRDVKRPDDVPTRPEVERLAGTPVLCFYGDDDAADTCRTYAASPTFRIIAHEGAHRPTDAEPFVREILAQLRRP